MWPLGMVLWLVVVVAVLEELRARRPDRAEDSHRLALPGAALALVAGIAVLPTADNGSGSPPWAVDMVDDVDDAVLAAVEGRGPVLVDLYLSDAVTRSAPGLFAIFQEHGVPFYVSYDGWVRHFGEDRRYSPGRAGIRIYARGGPWEEAEPGERLIATSSPLSRDERDELRRLTDRVEDLIREHGLPLVEEAESLYAVSGRAERLEEIEELADDPTEAIRSGTVLELTRSSMTDVARNQLLDPEAFPPELIERWSELEFRFEQHTLKVFLSELDD